MKGIIPIATLLLFSCSSAKQSLPNEEDAPSKPQLIFLNYILTQDENGLNLELYNHMVTDGKLKKETEDFSTNDGDLFFAQLNNKGAILKSTALKNPLIKTIEYVDESGRMNKKIMDLNEAKFSLRLQLHPEATHIKVQSIGTPNLTLLNSVL